MAPQYTKQNGMALRPFGEERFFHIDLCAGSGMFGLGLKCVLGKRLRTIAYVERDTRAAALLVERMEEAFLDSAPVWDDVADCANPEFVEYVRQFDPLFVTAGYPCQPFSAAGKRLGEADERHLWPSIIEFIRLVKPRYFLLENVPGHLSLGFDTVVRDLQVAGYDLAAGLFPASEVGASHQRKRLFALAIMGDSAIRDGNRSNRRSGKKPGDEPANPEPTRKSDQILADTSGKGLQGCERPRASHPRDRAQTPGPAPELRGLLFAPGPGELELWKQLLESDPSIEPTLRGAPDGVAPGVHGDRLRLLGNGVVPLVVAYAFTLLAAAHAAPFGGPTKAT
jgi:DNA (cytosine-5)-methyltransferase 1